MIPITSKIFTLRYIKMFQRTTFPHLKTEFLYHTILNGTMADSLNIRNKQKGGKSSLLSFVL